SSTPRRKPATPRSPRGWSPGCARRWISSTSSSPRSVDDPEAAAAGLAGSAVRGAAGVEADVAHAAGGGVAAGLTAERAHPGVGRVHARVGRRRRRRVDASARGLADRHLADEPGAAVAGAGADAALGDAGLVGADQATRRPRDARHAAAALA